MNQCDGGKYSGFNKQKNQKYMKIFSVLLDHYCSTNQHERPNNPLFFLKEKNKKNQNRNNQIMSTTLENVLKTDFDMEALQARPQYEVIRAFVCPLCLVDKPPLY